MTKNERIAWGKMFSVYVRLDLKKLWSSSFKVFKTKTFFTRRSKKYWVQFMRMVLHRQSWKPYGSWISKRISPSSLHYFSQHMGRTVLMLIDCFYSWSHAGSASPNPTSVLPFPHLACFSLPPPFSLRPDWCCIEVKQMDSGWEIGPASLWHRAPFKPEKWSMLNLILNTHSLTSTDRLRVEVSI